MNKMKRLRCLGLIILLPLWMSACLYVEVQDDVRHPERIFRRARREIAQIQRRLPKVDASRRINVLLYDETENQLITVKAPLCVVEACRDLDENSREAAEWGKRCDFDWTDVRDLKHRAPGLLFEMNDEESRVLVWID